MQLSSVMEHSLKLTYQRLCGQAAEISLMLLLVGQMTTCQKLTNLENFILNHNL